MDRDKFEKLVWQGIEVVPKRFLEKLDNVDIIIEDEPTPAQMRKLKLGQGTKLFGLYEGVPQTKRRHYTWVLPDKITVFQKPIEEVCFTRHKRGSPEAADEIKKIVKNTVWHEIAHHFGMDEARVRKVERRKKL